MTDRATEARPDAPAIRNLGYLTLESPIEGHAVHTHVHGIVRGLREDGWSVTLWKPPSRGADRGPLRRVLDQLLLQVKLMARLGRPDALYVRGHFAALPSVLFARLRRIPVVIELNGPMTSVLSSWPWARPLLPLLTLSMRLQLRMSSAVVGGNQELIDSAIRLGARHAYVVPNGADTELFSPEAKAQMSLPPTYVSLTGTLAAWQGVELVLEAIESPRWPAGVKLVVVGDGAMAGRVEALADADGRVVFLGRVAQAQLPGIVAGSLAALSLRRGEGVIPLKLVEAMACGVPVVATDIAGQRELVDDSRCGILVSPDEPEETAAAIAALHEDPAEAAAMGARGREASLARFSWQHAADLTDAILRDVV